MDGKQAVSRLLFALIVFAVGWWLFGDTYAHYARRRSGDGSIPRAGSIRFAHFGTYRDYQLWHDIINDFERSHRFLHIRQEYIVGLAGHYNMKMRQQVLSHTLPDVALVQLGPFRELAEHFADLSTLLTSTSPAGEPLSDALDATGLAAFRVHGRQRGLPVSGGSLAIYGHLDCFERAGRFRGHPVPLPHDDWTIEEFRRTAELLTCDFDGDGRIDQFGFWLPRWIYYLPYLWSFGAEMTDDSQTQWKLIGAEAERAVSFYRDLALRRRVCPRDDEVPQLFQDVGFLTGKVALCVNGPWFMPFLADTKLADRYFVVPIPRGRRHTTRVTWDGIVMARDRPARSRAVARQFITFVLSKPVQDRIAQLGRAVPARRESTAAFIQPPGDSRRWQFVKALQYSRLQPLWPRFQEVDRVINDHLYRLIDPSHSLSAHAMLQQLAHDPVIRSVFVLPDS